MKYGIFIRGMARRAAKVSLLKQKKVTISKPRIVTLSGEKEIAVPSLKKTAETYYDESKLTTFNSFQLREDVLNGLKNIPAVNPTIIQMIAIPKILNGENVFCAAQTGSGKTLVYTIPILNKIQEQFDDGYVTRLSRPKALIVAPARELAMQILKVFKTFSYTSPFRSLGLIGQRQKKWQRDYLKGPVDVVVGTPNTILKYIKRGKLFLSDLQFLVLDEADTLIDDNFEEVTNSLLENSQKKGDIWHTKPTQYIFTAATLPKKIVLNRYKEFVPNIELCQSNLHKVLPNVKHVFVKTTQQEKADLALEEIGKFSKSKPNKKCIVFCNTSKSCNWMAHLLTQQNILFSKMHGNMNPQVRVSDYEKFSQEDTNILVCTDVASRGLDLQEVSLVINLDCPFNSTDYIHRSGRIGRVGSVDDSTGRVVTYVTQRKEVAFAHQVQDAVKKNKVLDDIREKKDSDKNRHAIIMSKFLSKKS